MFNLFGSSSPFDVDVEKATSENNTTEQWDLIIDICDKAGANSKNAKDCLRSIMKRMGHNDPHVAIQAITLLDSCIKNCGRIFHLEIASRDFETEFQRLMLKTSSPVAQKMRVSLKKWATNEFKIDHQLNLIPSLYQKLLNEGLDFSETYTDDSKSQIIINRDPNIVSSQQEEDDIAKAIELSLKGKDEFTKDSTLFSTIYPNMSLNEKRTQKDSPQRECRKVRALYDFEAAEENELTFFSGEIIYVRDDSDTNWWTGYNDRGEGLFPSNFVTADLNVEIELNRHAGKVNTQNVQEEIKAETVQIDEIKIDRLLHLLHEANPEDPSQDSDEMFMLEAQVNQMLPLIDNELECVDRHHAKLTQLSTNLVEAINMYHTLMRESDMQTGSISHISPNIYRQPLQSMGNIFNPYFPIPSQHIGNSFINPDGSTQQFGVSQIHFDNIDASIQSLNPNNQQVLQISHLNQQYVQAPAIVDQNRQYTSPHASGLHIHAMQNNNQPQNMVGYIPNTVMTTQVQHDVIQGAIIQQASSNDQHLLTAVNHPVSSTILQRKDSRPNLQLQQQK